MDTISRENNSLLPVGGIILGVIALLLGGYSTIKLVSVKKTLASYDEKVAKIDTVESQANTAAATSEKAARDIVSLTHSTQDAITQIGQMIGEANSKIAKLEKASAPPAHAAKVTAKPVVAGPNEYIIKSGDTFSRIARAHGTTISAIQAVNPGVDSTRLHIGQKIKLPKK